MATILDKVLKRQVTVDGVAYTVDVDPEGLRLIGKGKRNPEVELRWRDLLNGEAAMAVALNASLSHRQTIPKEPSKGQTEQRAEASPAPKSKPKPRKRSG